MKAIILAAGKGERMRPLTNNLPKPMIPIDNKPILEYLIKLCKKHNINEIAINTSYLSEKIKDYFGDGSTFGVKLHYSFEPEALGTAGALNNFRELFNETFFVIYGDNITNLNLSEMLEYHKSKKGFGTLFIRKESIKDDKTTIGAVIIGNKGQIIDLIENPNEFEKEYLNKLPENKKWTNTGIYLLEPEILKLIPRGFSDFSRDIFPKILRSGNKNRKLFGFKKDCYFREVGQFIRYNLAKKEIEFKEINFDFI